jgi:hypothetical protein
LDAA